jgi:hypothetical protein
MMPGTDEACSGQSDKGDFIGHWLSQLSGVRQGSTCAAAIGIHG